MPRFRSSIAVACRASAGLLLAVLLAPTPAALGSPVSQVPSCVVGTWRPIDLEQTYRAIFAQIADLQLEDVTGDASLVIRDDSSYEIRYAGLTISAATSAGPVSVTTG